MDTDKQAEGQVIRCSPACPKNLLKSTLLLLLRGGVSQKVKVLIWLIDERCLLQWPGSNIYTRGLAMSLGQTRPISNLEKKIKFPKL